MTKERFDGRPSDGRTPTSVWLMRNPIDFIAEDHLRLRTVCAEIDQLADADKPDPRALAELHDYLTGELPALLADEDKDLMPLVLKRAEPDDELPKLARRLEREHGEIEQCLDPVVGVLATPAPASRWSQDVRVRLRDLAAAIRRHLILENAVLLPLARARLNPPDLIALRQAMLRRRGLQDLFAD